MTQPPVLFETDEAVATIRLNDGLRMNPLCDGMVQGLRDAVERVRDDRSLRALVITGQGRGFCVGADLASYREMLEQPAAGPRLAEHIGDLMARMNPVLLSLKELPVPVVCAVNGAAAGGGAGLALAGDVVIAAKSAFFYLPFVPALGIVPDMGSSWVLPRAIGRSRAIGLSLLAPRLTAQQALEWGLIWGCVDDDALQAEAQRLARQLAGLPPGAVLEARAIFAAAERNTLAQQLDLERTRQMALVGGPSFAEGVRAFAERRKPDFR